MKIRKYALIAAIALLCAAFPCAGFAFGWAPAEIPKEVREKLNLWEYYSITEEGDSYIAYTGEKHAILDAQGNVLIEYTAKKPEKDAFFGDIPFCAFTGFGERGWAVVDMGGKWGIIDNTGKTLLPFEYDLQPVFMDGIGMLMKDGKCGFIAEASVREGRLLTDIFFEDTSGFYSDLCAVKTGGKWGYIDTNGEYVISPRFEEACHFKNGYAMIKENGKWGYINLDGKMHIEPRFYAANDFEGIYAVVAEEKGKYGVINAKGEYILPPEYSNIEQLYGATAVAAMKDKKSHREFYNLYANAALKVGDILASQPLSAPFKAKRIDVYGWGVVDSGDRVAFGPGYEEIILGEDGVIKAREKQGSEVFKYYSIDDHGHVKEIAKVGSSFTLEEYYPNAGSLVAKLSEEPTLAKRVSKKHPLPAADGATALFPVYSAFVETLYPTGTQFEKQKNEDGNPLITCTRTNQAYRNLIEGRADIIFVAQPSDAQIAAAAEKGVEFELTPFGKEAFVFIVNRENPLENITVEQIQSVYSGKTAQWDELGVSGLGDIIPYQRPKDSGSQTALEKLMGDVPLMDAPTEVVAWDMGDIIDNIEYRNLPNALGYTFRFYCTEMVGSDVKLLSIDGIAPTVENIRNGSYPITSTLYAVTRKGDKNPNTRAMLEWIKGEQAMQLVEKSGYVAWYEYESGEPAAEPETQPSGDLCDFTVEDEWEAPARFKENPESVHDDQLLEYAYDDYAVVRVNGRCGLINRLGEFVIPPVYQEMTATGEDNTITALNGDGIRYFALEGNSAREVKGIDIIIDLEDYMPNSGNLTAILDDPPTLSRRVTKEYRLPHADGSESLFPLYSAFVQAVYPDGTKFQYKHNNNNPMVTCTGADESFERLIKGDADIIFISAPTDEQTAAAEKAGVELVLTPIGMEALVFTVNGDNPLETITLGQIRDIYSGKTVKWDGLGISGLGAIIPYQRHESHDCQADFVAVMGDAPLMDAPWGVVEWIKSEDYGPLPYRNLDNAIGYAPLFFCRDSAEKGIKLLSIDGAYPDDENIRSGAYPVTGILYAVTRKGDANPNTNALLEWIQSEQGMQLVEKSGYVPFYTFEEDLGTFADGLE